MNMIMGYLGLDSLQKLSMQHISMWYYQFGVERMQRKFRFGEIKYFAMSWRHPSLDKVLISYSSKKGFSALKSDNKNFTC